MEELNELHDNCYISKKGYEKMKQILILKDMIIEELFETNNEYKILLGEMSEGQIQKGLKVYDFKYII